MKRRIFYALLLVGLLALGSGMTLLVDHLFQKPQAILHQRVSSTKAGSGRMEVWAWREHSGPLWLRLVSSHWNGKLVLEVKPGFLLRSKLEMQVRDFPARGVLEVNGGADQVQFVLADGREVTYSWEGHSNVGNWRWSPAKGDG